MRIVFAAVCLVVLSSCGTPRAALPVPVDNRASVVSQGIGTNAEGSAAWCRPSDNQIVLALIDNKTTAVITSVDTSGVVGWRTELPYPTNDAVPMLGMHHGNIAVCWRWEDGAIDSSVARIELLDPRDGSVVGSAMRRTATEDATLALTASPFHDGSILQSMLEADTTVGGESHDMETVTVWFGTSLTVARSCSMILAGDLATWNAVLDPATQTYYTCLIRDSLIRGGDTLRSKILEVQALSEGGSRRTTQVVEVDVDGTETENVVISTGIDNGTPIAWLEFQAEDDGDVRRIVEINLSDPQLQPSFSHTFSEAEMLRITGEEDMDEVVLRDMARTSVGRVIVLEQIDFISARYNPAQEAARMSMPNMVPMYTRPAVGYHSSIHRTTADELAGTFRTYQFYVVCIDDQGALRWTARMNRDHTHPDGSTDVTTTHASDYSFYLGAEKHGALPIMFRNGNGEAMVSAAIDLSDGTYDTPRAVLRLDKLARTYATFWTGEDVMHFFLRYGDAHTMALVTVRP